MKSPTLDQPTKPIVGSRYKVYCNGKDAFKATNIQHVTLAASVYHRVTRLLVGIEEGIVLVKLVPGSVIRFTEWLRDRESFAAACFRSRLSDIFTSPARGGVWATAVQAFCPLPVRPLFNSRKQKPNAGRVVFGWRACSNLIASPFGRSRQAPRAVGWLRLLLGRSTFPVYLGGWHLPIGTVGRLLVGLPI